MELDTGIDRIVEATLGMTDNNVSWHIRQNREPNLALVVEMISTRNRTAFRNMMPEFPDGARFDTEGQWRPLLGDRVRVMLDDVEMLRRDHVS